MRNAQRGLLYAGLAAPLIYVGTVVAGGWATPGYSHLAQPVSALFEAGAPHALAVSLAFVAYNALLVAFGVGLLLAQPTRLGRLAAAMILVNGGIGLVIELAPMDPVDAPATPAGTIHLVLAGLLVATCLAAMACLALQWWRDGRQRLVAATAALVLVMLITGALAAMAAAASWPLLGLYQRFTIGSYLLWLPLVAVVTLRRPLSAG